MFEWDRWCKHRGWTGMFRSTLSVVYGTSNGRPGSGDRDDVHNATATAGAELHRAGVQREQGVVAATAHARTGVEVGAALADEDLAGVDLLAAEALDAEALSVRVTTVTSRACALLVSHFRLPLLRRVDAGHAERGVALTVAHALAVTGLVLVL